MLLSCVEVTAEVVTAVDVEAGGNGVAEVVAEMFAEVVTAVVIEAGGSRVAELCGGDC